MNDLERLVAIEGLRSLQARYVRYADAGDWRWPACSCPTPNSLRTAWTAGPRW